MGITLPETPEIPLSPWQIPFVRIPSPLPTPITAQLVNPPGYSTQPVQRISAVSLLGCDKQLRPDETSADQQTLAENIDMAVKMHYSGISNEPMVEGLADALVLHISRQAESIINDWINNYSQKAVAIML